MLLPSRELCAALIAPGMICPLHAQTVPHPGSYRIEVRISLPNVQDVAAPLMLTHCFRQSDLVDGSAYAIRSENPLSTCQRVDLRHEDDATTFGIQCPGPNMGHAKARFESTSHGFRGTIYMNMGGKNMTMSETQNAIRTGDCE